MKEDFSELYKAGETSGQAVERLERILRLLRGEDGCPWDKAQTHESIKGCVIEEAYETLDAIERGDMDNLEEELGDLLLQVVFHGGMGGDKGIFDLKSIANRVSDKMIRRHPHIFLKETAKTIDKVLEKWENVKRQEKGEPSHSEILDSIPRALPALIRGHKVQAKAAEAGFDWDDVSGAFMKLREEMAELFEAYQEGDKEKQKDELGDLLFSAVNAARFLGIDPEEALNDASRKFIKRFRYVESAAANAGRRLDDMSIDEMDVLWEQAKRRS
ncbi:MAG: nucleoside triphosphate pyrophosphohydrolase [Clostridiales Family XIII bacterium]|nr:nucleoside triphosphate pyrophosphohydrolase [Clostridiales Family XIII bacterium]